MILYELQKIVKKYQDFNAFLNGIQVEELKQLNRKELEAFREELRQLSSFRLLWLEIDKIIKEKKTEEYPELLGVHHYPDIKDLDCLSEEDQIKLDEYIVRLGLNRYLQTGSHAWLTLTKGWEKEIKKKVLQFLVDRDILERMYRMDVCHDTMLLTQEKVDMYLKYFQMKKHLKELKEEDWTVFYELKERLEVDYCCMDCDHEVSISEKDIQRVIDSEYSHVYKVIKDRDKSLDNV